MQVSLAGVPGVEKRRLGADGWNEPSRVRQRATRRLRELMREVTCKAVGDDGRKRSDGAWHHRKWSGAGRGIGEFFKKRDDHKLNVALALSKWGKLDLHYIQPEIKVLPEGPGADRRFQIAIGGGDDANIDMPAFGRADRLHFAFLQSAQELGLQVDGHVADFVEKERAALGCFQQTLLGLHGASERALHVAEELRFDERGHQRRTVHGGEGALLADSRVMNAFSHQFLARAALTQDQDGIFVLADLFDHFVDALHLCGDADHSAKAGRGAKLLA
jgi:hypothetical protein